MIADTMTRLWGARGELGGLVMAMQERGDFEAARELRQAVHRLGNQMQELDAVVQQYADEIAEVEGDGGGA